MINIDYVCASSVTIEKTTYYAQNSLPVSHLSPRQTGATVIPGNKRRKRDKEREGRRRGRWGSVEVRDPNKSR